MVWVNLGLIGLILALAIGLTGLFRPQLWPVGRILAVLALQLSGILIVTWFLVGRGQAVGTSLPPAPEAQAAVWSQVGGPALASLELVLLAAIWGTSAGTAAAGLVAWARRPSLGLIAALASLVWIVPTFLIAIFAQDLQSSIYGLSGVNVSGGYGVATPAQIFWSAAVLAIRPAAYSFRQSQVLIADQARAGFVRTALAKGLRWRSVVWRHILRPAGAGLVETAVSSIRLMFGSLPLVEFFFAYPGLGRLLLLSLGVAYGSQAPAPNADLAIASAVLLAAMLATLEALMRVFVQRLDPRLAEAAA